MPNRSNSTSRSINRLTIAVWALVIVTVVQLSFSAVALFFPSVVTKKWNRAMLHWTGPSEPVRFDEFNNFHDWPVEKQVQAASVIAIGKYQKSGDTLKCMISEILKQKPDAAFYYKIGDEFRPGSQVMRDNTTYGDGQIIFFAGSPASFRYSCGFTGDRIRGMGGMPLSELRELIRKSKE